MKKQDAFERIGTSEMLAVREGSEHNIPDDIQWKGQHVRGPSKASCFSCMLAHFKVNVRVPW